MEEHMGSYLGKTIFGVLVLSFSVLACFSAVHAYTYTDLGNMELMSWNDPWNISPNNPAGNQIDASSPTIDNPDFGPARLFGYEWPATDGHFNTIFQDGNLDPKVVQWHTVQAITLTGVNLFASLDKATLDRVISHFSLFYSMDDGDTWNPIIENFATGVGSNNQGHYSIVGPDYWAMAAGFSFDPVTASYFKAEFTQLSNSGARVCELDAITGSVVPLPGAVWLLGSGLLGLGGLSRWRRRRS